MEGRALPWRSPLTVHTGSPRWSGRSREREGAAPCRENRPWVSCRVTSIGCQDSESPALESVVVHRLVRVHLGAVAVRVTTVGFTALGEGPTAQGPSVQRDGPVGVHVVVAPQRVMDVGAGRVAAGAEAVALGAEVVAGLDVTVQRLVVLQVVVVRGEPVGVVDPGPAVAQAGGVTAAGSMGGPVATGEVDGTEGPVVASPAVGSGGHGHGRADLEGQTDTDHLARGGLVRIGGSGDGLPALAVHQFRVGEHGREFGGAFQADGPPALVFGGEQPRLGGAGVRTRVCGHDRDTEGGGT